MFLVAIFGAKIKILAWMPDLGSFGLESENNTVIFDISTLEFVQPKDFAKKKFWKKKCLKLGLTMPYMGIFGQQF